MMYTNGTEQISHRNLQNKLGMSFPRNKPPEGWSVVDNTPPEPTAGEFLSRQKNKIRSDAEKDYSDPVTDQSGRTWSGGFDSAIKIKSAADMAEFSDQMSIALYDINNDEHVVTLTEAKRIAAIIGAVFQQKLAAKQDAMRALNSIDLSAPDAKQQIESVTYQ